MSCDIPVLLSKPHRNKKIDYLGFGTPCIVMTIKVNHPQNEWMSKWEEDGVELDLVNVLYVALRTFARTQISILALTSHVSRIVADYLISVRIIRICSEALYLRLRMCA
jgi:hypothetical protein